MTRPIQPPDPPTDPPTAAQALAHLGWHVLPIKPGGKHPPLKEWRTAATTNTDIIHNWWNGLYTDCGVGILTGPQSGLWVLDIDTHGHDGYAAINELQDAYHPLPHTVTAQTGGGGQHHYYRWNPQHPITNGSATRLPDGIDTRGEGGQVVAPPTNTGNGYKWLNDPWTTPLAEAPAWLYGIIETPATQTVPERIPLNTTPTTPSSRTSTAQPHTDSPADWYRHHGPTWPQLLEQAGWTQQQRHHTGGDTCWVRPGKDARDGHSAVLHGNDGPLVVFSTDATLSGLWAAASKTGGEASLSKWDFHVATQHRGDTRAAAAAIRKQMQPPAPHQATTVADDTYQGDEVGEHALPGFVDLAPWWDNPQPTKTADALTRTDGIGLLYSDQLNWIHGDSGSGKTWILLAGMTQMIQQGHHVAWIHYEDPNPTTITQRLRMLGLTRQQTLQHFHYYDPQGDPLNAAHIIELCQALNVRFVGLDSVGEALNASGVNEDSDAEVGPWISYGPRKIVNAGIGFCGVDHGTKNGTNELHPSGSKRKRAALTGMGLLVKSTNPPTKDSDGVMTITCAKDRHGNHRQTDVVGVAHLRHTNPLTDDISLTIDRPLSDADHKKVEHDKRLREVVRVVEDHPGMTKTQVRTQLSGYTRRVQFEVINEAIEKGMIVAEMAGTQSETLHPNTPKLSTV